MQPIISAQIELIAKAQEEYKLAVDKQSPQGAVFWLSQLQGLCQQLHWLRSPDQAASQNHLVNQTPISSLTLKDIPSTARSTIQAQEQAKKQPPTPTSYAWNDGFEGVTLDNLDDEE